MKSVYYPGVWDLFHVGHVNALRYVKERVFWVVVGVASDEVVRIDKGTYPVISQGQRMECLEACRYVDSVAVYERLEFLSALNLIRPNYLAVGEQWGREQRHIEAEEWCRRNGAELLRVPRTAGISSTVIVNRIKGRGKCHD